MSDKIITHPQSEEYRRGYDAIDWGHAVAPDYDEPTQSPITHDMAGGKDDGHE